MFLNIHAFNRLKAYGLRLTADFRARRRIGRRFAGFTLMELLVVLGLFSIVITSATDILMMSSRAQRKTFNLEKTQADARYTMETMAREIRTGFIDYVWYEANEPLTGVPSRNLALVRENGERLRFYVEDSQQACGAENNTPCVMVTLNETASAAITPKGVEAKYARFYLSPKSDPYQLDIGTGAFLADDQPQATIVLVLESTGPGVDQRSLVHFQTTVVSRAYRR
ncbi:MAG: prepilin-type N-terminal cleavage/methylation domain-containing protein [Patescibacteria group bacterium]|nr:prepilin-type N-terminal cleavage/methylation domain-containing protein [Patescibacteria group bacterium]